MFISWWLLEMLAGRFQQKRNLSNVVALTGTEAESQHYAKFHVFNRNRKKFVKEMFEKYKKISNKSLFQTQ